MLYSIVTRVRLLLFSLLSVFAYQSCIPEECEGGQYTFELPATLSPALDTYNIGDTITLFSEFSDEVFEKNRNKNYKLENFNFFPSVGLIRIDSITNNNILSTFEYVDVVLDEEYNTTLNTYSTGNQYIDGEYVYKNNTYSLKSRIVLKQKGLFFFNFGSSLYPRGELQDFPGRCNKHGYTNEAEVFLNNRVDNNFDFLLDSPIERYNTWIVEKPHERFHRFGGYCFYVE